MPLTLSLIDDAGVSHPNLFVLSENARIDWKSRTAVITLGCYHDISTWATGKQPVETKMVMFTPEPDELGRTFEDFFSLLLLANPNFNLPVSLELHLSQLSMFAGSQLVGFPE